MARRRKVQAQPKPEESQVVNDQTTGPAFELTDRWRWAVDDWRRSLGVEEIGAEKKLSLSIPRTPTKEQQATVAVYRIDPPPTHEVHQRLRAEPGLRDFVRRASKLADATTTLLPLLRRHDARIEEAQALIEALRDRADSPRLTDLASALEIQAQLRAIQERIWQGCLPPDEDRQERRAFWNHQLAGVRTPDGHAQLKAAVDQLLAAPRDPGREVTLLNRFLHVSQEEDALLVIEPMRRINGIDPLSASRRWRELLEFGSRSYGLDKVCFRRAVLNRRFYPSEKAELEIAWAELLRSTTLDLHILAEKAGFSPGERLWITEMVHAMDGILEGKTVVLSKAARAVELLVDAIVAQAKRSRRAILDRVHQLAVDLKEGTTKLLGLVQRHGGDATGLGLMALDHYVDAPEPIRRQPGLGGTEDLEWRILTRLAAANLSEADQLWNQEVGDPPRPIRQDFTLVGKAPVAISTLQANSAHELVLTVARVLLTPESPGSAPNDALEMVGPGPNGKPCPGVVRLRAVSEMIKMPTRWPPQMPLDLDREHAAAGVLPLPVGMAAAPAASTPSAPAAGSRRQVKRRDVRQELPDIDIVVLRALPKSTELALRTLASLAARIATNPRPSVSTMSRSIQRLRSTNPPLADPAAYRRSREGDAAEQ